MEEGRRKAYIKAQATAKKKQDGSFPPKSITQIPPSKKRSSEKSNCPPKKPKETAMLPGRRKGKDLMKGQVPDAPKPPILLCKDSQYALE